MNIIRKRKSLCHSPLFIKPRGRECALIMPPFLLLPLNTSSFLFLSFLAPSPRSLFRRFHYLRSSFVTTYPFRLCANLWFEV